jgi:hypothetical protein
VGPGLQLKSRLFCKLHSEWMEHEREQLWSFVKDNSVPIPEEPFLHHPWVKQVAQLKAKFGIVPENVRANRAKKIG